jgi:hypothetical protein
MIMANFTGGLGSGVSGACMIACTDGNGMIGLQVQMYNNWH